MDQDQNEIRQDGELFVDRTWRRNSTFVRRENSLYAPEIPAVGEREISPNLNVGRASDPHPELLEKNQRAREQAQTDAGREVMAGLQKAHRQLHPQPPR